MSRQRGPLNNYVVRRAPPVAEGPNICEKPTTEAEMVGQVWPPWPPKWHDPKRLLSFLFLADAMCLCTKFSVVLWPIKERKQTFCRWKVSVIHSVPVAICRHHVTWYRRLQRASELRQRQLVLRGSHTLFLECRMTLCGVISAKI